MKQVSEETIIKNLAIKIQQSDRIAFKQLFNLLWRDMFIFTNAILMDEDRSKDVLQETWIEYWEKRKQIENKNIKAYLFTLTRYRVYKILKKAKLNQLQLHTIQELSDTFVYADIELNHDLEATNRIVTKTLQNLPQRCKEIFELSRFKGVKNHEIAIQFGISKRSVENQISVALRKIKFNLKK